MRTGIVVPFCNGKTAPRGIAARTWGSGNRPAAVSGRKARFPHRAVLFTAFCEHRRRNKAEIDGFFPHFGSETSKKAAGWVNNL